MSLRSTLAAIASAFVLTTAAQAQDPQYDVYAWLWGRMYTTPNGDALVLVDVMMKSDYPTRAVKVFLEFDASRFTFAHLNPVGIQDYVMVNEDPEAVGCAPSCGGMGEGQTDLMVAMAFSYTNFDVTTATSVMQLEFNVIGGADSMICQAEPIKFYCAQHCYEGSPFTTEFDMVVDGEQQSYYWGMPGESPLALGNTCVVGHYGYDHGCTVRPQCLSWDGWGYTECMKCPPSLDPTKPTAVRPETWGTVKRLYQ